MRIEIENHGIETNIFSYRELMQLMCKISRLVPLKVIYSTGQATRTKDIKDHRGLFSFIVGLRNIIAEDMEFEG